MCVHPRAQSSNGYSNLDVGGESSQAAMWPVRLHLITGAGFMGGLLCQGLCSQHVLTTPCTATEQTLSTMQVPDSKETTGVSTLGLFLWLPGSIQLAVRRSQRLQALGASLLEVSDYQPSYIWRRHTTVTVPVRLQWLGPD
jgi:hypothetical protein